MKPLYNILDFQISSPSTLFPLECYQCKQQFYLPKNRIREYAQGRNSKYKASKFCSKKCCQKHSQKRIQLECLTCSKKFERTLSSVRSTKTFCSSSCSAKYNNTHKTHGTRRSKLEVYLEKKLKEKYPDFEIHFNRKDAINSELDIYIPSLKLAFELNGIYHYEPIHGPEKLVSIKNNDQRKFQACLERNIELCIIDTSSFDYFKEDKAKEFFNIILNVIKRCVEDSNL